MKKLISFLFFSILIFRLAAQTSVTGKIEVVIAIPVTATETDLLNFGRILPETAGGTVSISAAGVRTATGSVTLMDETYTAGKFTLTGMPSSLVSIVLPQTPQKLTLANGSSEVTVTDFVSDVPTGGQVIRQSDGKAEVHVGATLYVGNGLSNPAGLYTGTYEVVFTYN